MVTSLKTSLKDFFVYVRLRQEHGTIVLRLAPEFQMKWPMCGMARSVPFKVTLRELGIIMPP